MNPLNIQHPIVVQKFGGTSVMDAACMARSARHAIAATRRGLRVVLVVSAMGHHTDELLELAGTVSHDATDMACRRELDQLLATGEQAAVAMMALVLRSMGAKAVSLTGGQAGIRTDSVHGRSAITGVDPGRLVQLLEQEIIPVVAGFQGICPAGDVTTLGRGGSDITAVALAAALGGTCEIYKDVDGVFTADPRLVPEARLRAVITYEEMIEAAVGGSQVIHPRAVELARSRSVPLRVLHSQAEPGQTGTIVSHQAAIDMAGEASQESTPLVSSVVLKKRVGRISLRGLPARLGVQSAIFSPLAARHLLVDDIIQEEGGDGRVWLTFTLDDGDLPEATQIVAEAVDAMENHQASMPISVESSGGLCTVSAVGIGMRTASGVAAMVFEALAAAGIAVQNISTSDIRISCVMEASQGPTAVGVLHCAFGLQSMGTELRAPAAGSQTEMKPGPGITRGIRMMPDGTLKVLTS